METKPISLKKLAEKLNLKFFGNGDLLITHVCGLNSLQAGGLAYLTSPDGLASVPVPAGMSKKTSSNLDDINSSHIVFIVPPEVKILDKNLIISSDPLASHVEATKLIYPIEDKIPELTKKLKIHPTAYISKNVKLGKNVLVGPKAIIYEGVNIGANTIIHSGVVIMSDTVIGNDCIAFVASSNVMSPDKNGLDKSS